MSGFELVFGAFMVGFAFTIGVRCALYVWPGIIKVNFGRINVVVPSDEEPRP